MARETGLEPAASAVTGRRSNQLSYSRGCEIRSDPREGEDLKARPLLVKDVANPRARMGIFATSMQIMAYLQAKQRRQPATRIV